MRPPTHSTIGAVALALLTPSTTALWLKNVELINHFNTSYSYCAPPNTTTNIANTNLSSSTAHAFCAAIPPTLSLLPANDTSQECKCSGSEADGFSWVVCNCNSCAGLLVEGVRKTCKKFVDWCLTGVNENSRGEDIHVGGYLVRAGDGLRAYFSLHRGEQFERPALGVRCVGGEVVTSDEGSRLVKITTPIGDEKAASREVTEVVEPLSYKQEQRKQLKKECDEMNRWDRFFNTMYCRSLDHLD